MKIALAADVHLGNHRLQGGPVGTAGINLRGRLILDALASAYSIARGAGCEAMVICGDLFDTSKPAPQMIAAAQKIIREGGLPTHVLMGNHDMASAGEGDHALGPLEPVASVISRPARVRLKGSVDEVDLWAVPFRPGKAEEWLPAVLAEVQGFPAPGSPASSSRVLALHLGLQDEKTPPWLCDSHDSVQVELVQELMKRHDIDATYMGNWHDPKEVTYHDVDRSVTQPLRIIQIGTLCPTGFDNPGLGYGTMAIHDSLKGKNCETVRVPGPRFVATVPDAEKAKKSGCSAFLRLRVSPDEMPRERERARQLEATGIRVELVPDAAEAAAALRIAAGASRDSESVEQSIAAYVEQMPLEIAEIRPAVLERVKRYLGGAA